MIVTNKRSEAEKLDTYSSDASLMIWFGSWKSRLKTTNQWAELETNNKSTEENPYFQTENCYFHLWCQQH